MPLTLVRHTRVLVPDGVCYGRTDVPLASTFTHEAESVRSRLLTHPKIVYSSPAMRCRRLACVLGPDVRIDERLSELNFGDWENRRWDDLPRTELDSWAANFVGLAPPRGETFLELMQRIEWFRRDCPTDDSVVVTHAGIIRAWLCIVENRSPVTAFERNIDFGQIVLV